MSPRSIIGVLLHDLDPLYCIDEILIISGGHLQHSVVYIMQLANQFEIILFVK